MTSRPLLITAALPYANGDLHVGHIAGAYLPADIYVRFQRMRGKEVRSVCGSDDYGVAMVLAAKKEGTTPRAVAAKYHDIQRQTLESLSINFDTYGSTSQNPYHQTISQEFFKRLHEKGYFEKKATPQYYDAEHEMFLPDRFVRGECGHCGAADQNGDQCESCGKELNPETLRAPKSVMTGSAVELKETTHWFLDLGRQQQAVEAWLERATIRKHTRAYVTGLIADGLISRSMTRDLDWGIPVPLEDPDAKNKVLYVWFDAPIGYISNTAELGARNHEDSALERWWKSGETDIFHFIGEDNTVFHALIWIAMLSAHGEYQLPKGVIVNHFLNYGLSDGTVEKMSKSKGTAVWIENYLASGRSADSLRYYLTMVAPETARAVYRVSDLVVRNNSELGAALGNLFQRIIKFTRDKMGGVIPQSVSPGEAERELRSERDRCFAEVTELLETFQFRDALGSIMAFARTCNRYVDTTAPWKAIKSDPSRAEEIIHEMLDCLKFFAVVIAPFMPTASGKALRMLALNPSTVRWDDAVTGLEAGVILNEAEVLFPMMEG